MIPNQNAPSQKTSSPSSQNSPMGSGMSAPSSGQKPHSWIDIHNDRHFVKKFFVDVGDSIKRVGGFGNVGGRNLLIGTGVVGATALYLFPTKSFFMKGFEYTRNADFKELFDELNR